MTAEHPTPRCIVLVEDNLADAELIDDFFADPRGRRLHVIHCGSLAEGLAAVSAGAVDAVVLDLNLPDGRGVACVVAMRQGAGAIPIVVLTGNDDEVLALACLSAGAQDYLSKTHLEAESLWRALGYAIARTREVAERHRADALQRWLAMIVEASSDAIVSTDQDGLIASWNRGATEIFGYTAAEAICQPWRTVIRPPDDAPSSQETRFARTLDGAQPFTEEVVRLRRDGQRVMLSVAAYNLRDLAGKIVGLAATCRDITETKRLALEESALAKHRAHVMARLVDDIANLAHRIGLADIAKAPAPVIEASYDDYPSDELMAEVLAPFETAFRGYVEANARLEEHNRELGEAKDAVEIANRELEAFNHSVAHDLRAPLRAIDAFSRALVEDYEPLLDERGHDYIRRIRAATRRTTRLIDELLELSRVTRTEPRCTRFDLTRLAREVTDRLTGADPDARARVTIPDSLTTCADPALVEIVLENLIGNALKFSAKQVDPKVELGTGEAGEAGEAGEQVYFVRDNGAGFDPALSGRLFQVFQRLHAASEFEGSGVGLSIVQRIVRRHGGRVWADGGIGLGATFFFTLGLHRGADRARS